MTAVETARGTRVPGVVMGSQFMSMHDLTDRARHVAAGLRAFGVGPGAPVAVLARNDFVHLELALAAAQLGASILPVNWRWTGAEVCFVLEDSHAAVLVGHADLLTSVLDSVPAGVTTVWAATPPLVGDAYQVGSRLWPGPRGALNYGDWLARLDPLPAGRVEASSSGLFYTSGTTGRPKGVVRSAPTSQQLTQRRQVLTTCYGIGPGARMLITTPMHHIFAQGAALATLGAGGTVVVMPRFDAGALLDLIAAHRVTNVQMVPTMFVRLLRLSQEVRRRADVSSLRHVLHTGAPCPPSLKRAMLEWWGPVIWEQYGSTETGVVTLASPEEWLAHPGTVGRPFLTSEVGILDVEGRRLGPGEVGQIFARMHGSPDFTYLGRPEATGLITRDGLVTAGDLGYLDADGFLHLVDRRSDVVISGGVNIYPAEVEAALLDHPDVIDAAVFGVEDPEYGEKLVSMIVVDPSASYDADRICSFLSLRLAIYKIPRIIQVVGQLPRDESGKISRRRLREEYRP